MGKIWFMDYVKLDNEEYFYSAQYNSILKKVMGNRKLTIIKQIFMENPNNIGNYISLEVFDNKIYLLPTSGKLIDILDVTNKTFKSLELERYTESGYTFFSSARIGRKIIGIPCKYAVFVVVDCSKDEKIEIEFDKNLLKLNEVKNDAYFTISYHIYEHMIFVGSRHSNYIVSISADTCEINYWRINSGKEGVYTLCGNGNMLYVMCNDVILRTYEICKDKLKEIDRVKLGNLEVKMNGWAKSIFSFGKVLIFPPEKEYIVGYDIKTGEINKYLVPQDNSENTVVSSIGYYYARREENTIRVMNARNNTEYTFDSDFKIINENSYVIDKEELNKLEFNQFSYEHPDGYLFSLKGLIDFIQ